ncbi:uncharacterized protein LOC124407676 [Diprion similis]|uniref:uncharacterized protein LOC124407676 n=1 Tax=Diprion similis TaxID=362088 RepID=UPI001EF9B617|nr:uncharacterized protein LOC124407676 [Diprion similis]
MSYCKDCDILFAKTTEYVNHMRKEHPRFSCYGCKKVFGMKRKLVFHMRSCWQLRGIKNSREPGPVISFANYKRLPIVTAEELDTEFQIYMDRKFGKKGVFRNVKTCKFCSQTFLMALDFADHIREHYKSIPLDATSVKSKFDFMKFMGLKIRETTGTDHSDLEAIGVEAKNKITDCRVVVIGERCKICDISFKCISDLEIHNRKYHLPNDRKKVTLVLRIGNEIISRLSVKKRHIRRGEKAACQSTCQRLKHRLNKMYESCQHPAKKNEKNRDSRNIFARQALLDDRSYNEIILNSDLALLTKEEIGRPDSNCIERETARENSIDLLDLDHANEARSTFGSPKPIYATNMMMCNLESGGIDGDDFSDNLRFSEQWKDDMTDPDVPWYSPAKLEKDSRGSDEDNCFCIEEIRRSPATKTKRTAWEDEQYNYILNGESEDCHEMNFDELPRDYKYHSLSAELGFPSIERSYGLKMERGDGEDDNNNSEGDRSDSLSVVTTPGYTGAIVVKKDGPNLTVNCSRTVGFTTRPHEDKFFEYQGDRVYGLKKGVVSAIDNFQEVLIKEEVMLDE